MESLSAPSPQLHVSESTTIRIIMMTAIESTPTIQYMHLPALFWSFCASSILVSASFAFSSAVPAFASISMRSARYSCTLVLISFAMSLISVMNYSTLLSSSCRCLITSSMYAASPCTFSSSTSSCYSCSNYWLSESCILEVLSLYMRVCRLFTRSKCYCIFTCSSWHSCRNLLTISARRRLYASYFSCCWRWER